MPATYPKKTKSAPKAAKRATARSTAPATSDATSGDWRAETLARVRAIMKDADRAIVEEVKWRKPSNPAGVPVWERDGIICTGETYKAYVKLTFANGAALDDPASLFNADDKGNVRRAINIHDGDKINEHALKALIGSAVTFNTARAKAKKAKRS